MIYLDPLLFQVYDLWTLPFFLCDVYIAMDVICSTASIFNLVAISMDRSVRVTSYFAMSVRTWIPDLMLMGWATAQKNYSCIRSNGGNLCTLLHVLLPFPFLHLLFGA